MKIVQEETVGRAACLRRARNVEELLPWLYLKGISTGEFEEALGKQPHSLAEIKSAEEDDLPTLGRAIAKDATGPGTIDLALRYRIAVERSLLRMLRELRDLQAARTSIAGAWPGTRGMSPHRRRFERRRR